MIGEIVSHYYILETLGRGGMGVVYKAQDTKLGRLVALKFLSEKFCRDQQAAERFQQEARTTSILNHPGICTIHDIDEHGGQPFIVMEFLEGRTLRQHMQNYRFTSQETVACGIQIADALGKAHAKGIVHRDISPANLFITDDGRVKMLDFGIAKLIPGGRRSELSQIDVTVNYSTLTGTVRYMSPEQALGKEVDPRSDIFSLGIVLYEMLTGRLPFLGANFLEIFREIIKAMPDGVRSVNPDVPLALENVVSKCLEKHPEQRYQTAAQLRKDLMQATVASVVNIECRVVSNTFALVIPEQTDRSLAETLLDGTTSIPEFPSCRIMGSYAG